MDIDELTIFGRYNLKDDKVTSVFLQVINYGGHPCSARLSIVVLISQYYRYIYYSSIS